MLIINESSNPIKIAGVVVPATGKPFEIEQKIVDFFFYIFGNIGVECNLKI